MPIENVPKSELKLEQDSAAHYYSIIVKGVKIDPLAVIRAKNFSFVRGNILKYVWRAGFKPGESALADLKKARTYLEMEIEELEKAETVKTTRYA